MNKTVSVFCLLVFAATNLFSQQTDFPELTGPYLGQKPPGEKPELFAPGIISVEANFEHSTAVFSPDGKYLFYSSDNDIYWVDASFIEDLKNDIK